MITGFDVNEQHEVVVPRDKDKPTVYVVSGLTVRVKQQALLLYDNGNAVEGMFKIVRGCLKKIKNYKVGAQEPKDFDIITDELVDSLPPDVFNVLSTEIMRISSLSEQEQKN